MVIVEQRGVERVANAAFRKWPCAEDAWHNIMWALTQNPLGLGTPVREDGVVRMVEYPGTYSLGEPSIVVTYSLEIEGVIVVEDVLFSDAPYHRYGLA